MRNFLNVAGHLHGRPAWLLVALIALALQGCANITSAVKGITLTSAGTRENDPSTGGTPIALDGQLNQPMTFQITGDGMCNRMFINYGDGTAPVEYLNVDLASKPTFTHTYTGWNGQKTVWAFGNLTDGCGGNARMPVRVGPIAFKVGYAQPVPTACTAVPGQPPLRKNSIVRITNINQGNSTADSKAVIDFGCVGGCYNSAMGLPGTAAGPDYPFPGLRERSLVIRVGTQAHQSDEFSSTFTFTTTEAGPLEICVNDFPLNDNSGGWGIGVTVDESAAE